MLFITHALPKALQVDAVVRLGVGPQAVVPTGPELHSVHGIHLGVPS